MPTDILLCYCSCPDRATADMLAQTLVEERLAACVTLLPQAASTYRWQGEVTTDAEVLLLIKTTADRFAPLAARVLQLHPYEVPELIGVPVTHGHAPYVAWIDGSVRNAG